MNGNTGFYVFASIKGGVGKSTLAVVTAKLIAKSGRKPLLIDADLTGTSLSDGLKLVAPKLPVDAAGILNLLAQPSGDYLTYHETRQARRQRDVSALVDAPVGVPFLNDALAFSGSDDDCRVDAMLWRHQLDDGVLYLPSSALDHDVNSALSWLNAEAFEWVRRLAWVLEAALRYQPILTDIVIDVPPGVWGFSHEALVLAAKLAQGQLAGGYPSWPYRQWHVHPFLVCSADMNDLLVSLEYVARHSVQLPNLVPLLNRPSHAMGLVRSAAAQELSDATVFGGFGLENKLEAVDYVTSLSRLFVDGNLSIGKEVESLSQTLRVVPR